MRKYVFLTVFLVPMLFASCQVSQSLYYWGGTAKGTTAYENATYQSYKKQSPEALCAMLCTYEEMVKKPGGVRMVPPPGVCAEYAFYLTLPETAEAWAGAATERQRRVLTRTDFMAYAAELFAMEIQNYPESAVFIKPLMEKLIQR